MSAAVDSGTLPISSPDAGFTTANESVVEAIYADKKSTGEDIRLFRALLRKTVKAIDILRDGEADASVQRRR